MTRTRSRSVLGAAMAVGALLLTAGCSGGGDDGAPITGGDASEGQGSEPADETAEEPGESDARPDDRDIDRPEIRLPDHVQTVFDGWESDDPREQAILTDAREQVNSTVLAVVERDPDAEYLSFYSMGMGLVNSRQWIQGFIDNERDIAGTARYHSPDVHMRDDGFVALNYCADMSEAVTLDINTGEEIESSSDLASLAYSTVLQETESGLWVTGDMTFKAQECGA